MSTEATEKIYWFKRAPVTFVVEVGHLLRAAKKYGRPIYPNQVIAYLSHKWTHVEPARVIVVCGSLYDNAEETKSKWRRHKYDCYVAALKTDPTSGAKYVCSISALSEALSSVKTADNVVLVGFHHLKYLEAIEPHANRLNLFMAAYATPSLNGGVVGISNQTSMFLKQKFILDYHEEEFEQFCDSQADRFRLPE